MGKVDEMGVDEIGVDAAGINRAGTITRRVGQFKLNYDYKSAGAVSLNILILRFS